MSNLNTEEALLLESTAKELNEKLELFAPVTFGRLAGECITLQLTGGEDERFLSGGRLRALSLLLLVKSREQEKALDAAYSIIDCLEGCPPQGALSVTAKSLPELVDRGEDGVIYEAQIEISAYQN